ncbi:hypothetical protein CIPAW_09G153000 [Carya illinoinensis]|uniref:Uncharacterized protein n=1 Tax=Carya illinoinensis TaxID=32201 RepID=A0A8T1PM76_CARIL|nr:hypothetical protein CIPAW_09G153000 [Carya illinoinensis]
MKLKETSFGCGWWWKWRSKAKKGLNEVELVGPAPATDRGRKWELVVANGGLNGGETWWRCSPVRGEENWVGGVGHTAGERGFWAAKAIGDRGEKQAGVVTSRGLWRLTAGPMALKIDGDDLWWEGKRMVVVVHYTMAGRQRTGRSNRRRWEGEKRAVRAGRKKPGRKEEEKGKKVKKRRKRKGKREKEKEKRKEMRSNPHSGNQKQVRRKQY